MKPCYRMPGEFEPHDGCIMIWPVRPGSWAWGGKTAQPVFCEIARVIGESEQVYMLCGKGHSAQARAALPHGVILLEIESDDAWARDTAPTFVLNDRGERFGIDWAFNAWGGEVDGLYPDWEKDDRVASSLCAALGERRLDAHPFVLEGGSIHSDGEGTLLTTEACLLSAGRNPSLTRREIEQRLCSLTGCEKVIWLPCGIFHDETNEHVDNVCTFVGPGEVVLAWTDDPSDPQYAMSRACERVLTEQADARGRAFIIHRLPIPRKPVLVGESDLEGYTFAPGEEIRTVGERLAASYVNFYISNGAVLCPQFGDENDAAALGIISRLFPDRKTVGIFSRDILLGGGNIHCITQQIPRRKGGIS